MKTVSILGSTGSIGSQTLNVIAERSDDFRAGWLTTRSRHELLEEQTRRFQPFGVAIADEEAYRAFKRSTSFRGAILCGDEGVREAASDARADVLMSALVGFSGVLPTHAALNKGIQVALANKETLVSAGAIITEAARQNGASILAVDSEHSAILQCLAGERSEEIEKLILTASGGPFRDWSPERLADVTPEQALRHPNWTMGSKITIDSATMMNKGFEAIEAQWLFDVPLDAIEVVLHPQSVIHSMAQFRDGSIKAQLGMPSMTIPIAYALSYPNRLPLSEAISPRADFAALQTLTFAKPDANRFPCLRLAYEAGREGGSAPAALNAANEIAVYAFLSKELRFTDIPRLVEFCLEKSERIERPTLEEIVGIDAETRHIAKEYVRTPRRAPTIKTTAAAAL